MTDLEVMQRAKTYMDKLANGVNPYTVVVYNRDAQQFLMDNMDAILGKAEPHADT